MNGNNRIIDLLHCYSPGIFHLRNELHGTRWKRWIEINRMLLWIVVGLEYFRSG